MVVADGAAGGRSLSKEWAREGAGSAAGGGWKLGQDAHLAIERHPGDLCRLSERNVR